MKPLVFEALAVDELEEARDWYERQAAGLGRRFVLFVGSLVNRIRENPQAFPVIHRDIRRAVMKSFPYGVFFRDRAAAIEVIGVVHLHRHPDTWKRRK